MKIVLNIGMDVTQEVESPILEELAKIHASSSSAIAPNDLYQNAIEELEKLTGMRLGDIRPPVTLWGVYTEDGTPILES